MARKLVVEVLADATSFSASMKEATAVSEQFSGAVTSSSKVAAQAVVSATVKTTESLKLQATAYREIAAAAEAGSAEQIAAARLAEKAEQRLAASMGVVSAEATRASGRVSTAGRELERFGRGALSGTGIMHGFGRSLAFASGGFLAFEGVSKFLTDSVSAARDAAAAQRSLAAQMKTSGESFDENRDRIEKVALSYGKLGYEDDQVIASLTVLERGTGNINKAIQLQGVTADIARAKNLDLSKAALIVAKVFGGQETALRRAVPGLERNAHGWDLLREAQKKVAGQAVANTNAAEQFSATLRNTEQIVGAALLPTLDRFLNSMTDWLSKSKNQERVQHDVEKAVAAATGAFKLAKGALDTLNKITGSTTETVKLLFSALLAFKGLKFAGVVGGMRGIGAEAEKSTGKVAGLRGALGSLPETVGVTMIVEAVIHKDQIDDYLKQHHLGFLTKSGASLTGDLLANMSGPLGQLFGRAGALGGGAGAGGNLFSPNFKFPNITANIPTPAAAAGFTPHDLAAHQAQLPIVGRGGLTAMQRNALAISAAGRTKTTKDDLAAYVTQHQLLAKAIATETGRLNRATSPQEARKFAQALQALQDKDAAAIAQIASISSQGAKQAAGRTPADRAAQRNTWFDNMIGRLIDRAQDNIPKLKHVAALIEQRIAVTKDITRKLNLEDTLATVRRTIGGDQEQQAADAQQRRDDARQRRLDAAQLLVDRAGLTKTLSDDLAALKHQLGVLKVEGATESEIVAKQGEIKSKEAEITQAGKDRLANLRQQKLDAATLAVARADLTGNLSKELAARKKQLAVMKQTGATQLDIANQQQSINDIQDQIDEKQKAATAASLKRAADRVAAINKAARAQEKEIDGMNQLVKRQRQAAVTARNAAQFRALGLTATGEQPTPGVEALQTRLANLRKQLVGTGLDRGKLHSQLVGAAKDLADGAGKPIRAAIDQIFDTIDSKLKDRSQKTLTHFKRVSATSLVNAFGQGLTGAQKRRLETALAVFGPSGTMPSGGSGAFAGAGAHATVIHGGVHLHGIQDVPAFENELVKRSNARGHLRRGSR